MSDCRVPMRSYDDRPKMGKRDCDICGNQMWVVCFADSDEELEDKLDEFVLNAGWKIDPINDKYICTNCSS